MNKNSLKAIESENLVNRDLYQKPKNISQTHKILVQDKKEYQYKTKKIKSFKSLNFMSKNDLKIKRISKTNLKYNKNILLNENSFEDKDCYNYDYYITKIKELELNCINSKIIFQTQIKDQITAYNENKKKKKELTFYRSPDKKTTSIKNYSIEINTFNHLDEKKEKAKNIYSNTEKSLKSKSLMKSISANKNNIDFTEIFDNYFKKFHFLYFQTCAEKICASTISNSNKSYKEKLESYIHFEDQIKELELLTTGDSENVEQRLIIETMIKMIVLERNQKLIELEKSNLNKNSFIKDKNLITNNNESDKLCKINEEFLYKFIEMFI